MSKLPYWRDNLTEVSISMYLNVTDHHSLEDGLFYGETLSVVDSVGRDIDFKLMSQDPDQTAKAGRGVYGQFRIMATPHNPCTVKYIPRFMTSTENHEYVKRSFDDVANVDISKRGKNLDDMISDRVLPDPNASLAFGNFSNSVKMRESLDRLTKTVSEFYYDINQLPGEIEAVYLNTKNSFFETLTAMRGLEVQTVNINQVMTDSVKILSRAPTGVLYGNYIYIAYKDSVEEYNGSTYVLKRGDVCLINQGVMTVLPYGTDYAYRIRALNNALSSLSRYADSHRPKLFTMNKDIDKAVLELEKITNGYYGDSLYAIRDITDGSIMDHSAGVVIATVSSPFHHNDVQYDQDDLLIIVDGNPTKVGVTADVALELQTVSVQLSVLLNRVKDEIVPIQKLEGMLLTSSEIAVPSKTANDIRIENGDMFINNTALCNIDLANYIKALLGEVVPSSHINNEELTKLISSVPSSDAVVQSMANDVNRLNDILAKHDKGEYTLVPMSTLSESGIYFNDNPVTWNTDVLSIRTIGKFPLNGLVVQSVKPIANTLFLFTDQGVRLVDIESGTIEIPLKWKTYSSATDVVTLEGIPALVSNMHGTSLIETQDTTYVAPGTVIGSVIESTTVILLKESGFQLYNLKSGLSADYPIDTDRAITSIEGTLLLKEGVPVATITKSSVNRLDNDVKTVESWSESIISEGYPYPTLKHPRYETGLKVVIL